MDKKVTTFCPKLKYVSILPYKLKRFGIRNYLWINLLERNTQESLLLNLEMFNEPRTIGFSRPILLFRNTTFTSYDIRSCKLSTGGDL